MRLVAGAVALALFAPLARADDNATSESPRAAPSAPGAAPSAARRPAPSTDAAHSKLPLRVVRVMPESRQALLFDRNRSTHVLAEVGRRVAGYTVEDIDDESVTLRRGTQQIVLAAPPRRPAPPATAQAPTAPVARPAASQAPAPTALPATAPAPSAPTAPVATAQAPATPTARSATTEAVAPQAAHPATTEALAGAEPSPRDPYADVPRDPSAAAPADPYAGAPADPYADPPVRAVEASEAAQPGGATGAEPSQGIRVARAPSAPGAPSAAVVAGDDGVRVAQAPPAPSGVSGEPVASRTPAVRVVEAPGAGSTTPSAPGAATTPSAPTAGPTPVAEVRVASAAPGAAPTSAPDASGGSTISRAELDRALADFAALTAAVRASFSAAGVVVDSVGAGTIFQRAGLRAGDVIASVDGIQLRSLDDAANLYARAATAKLITAQVVRAGKPVTLRMTIR